MPSAGGWLTLFLVTLRLEIAKILRSLYHILTLKIYLDEETYCHIDGQEHCRSTPRARHRQTTTKDCLARRAAQAQGLAAELRGEEQ